MHNRCLPDCNDTLLVQRSASVRMQMLKDNLAGDTDDPNALIRELVVSFIGKPGSSRTWRARRTSRARRRSRQSRRTQRVNRHLYTAPGRRLPHSSSFVLTPSPFWRQAKREHWKPTKRQAGVLPVMMRSTARLMLSTADDAALDSAGAA